MSKAGGLEKGNGHCGHPCTSLCIYPQMWELLRSRGEKQQVPQLDRAISLTPEVCVLEGLLAHVDVE